jgi:hypothetical protein
MTASETTAAVLLVVGPLLGAVPVAHPRLIPIWSMARDDFVRTVGAHRRAWAWLNAGFGFATVLTTAGLAIVAAQDPGSSRAAGLVLALVAYAMGGTLWLTALAIRSRTTPALADLDAPGVDPGPAEVLVGSATSGAFAGYAALTCAALVVLGVTYLVTGGIAAPVAALIALGGVGCLVWLLAAGDLIPAVLYLPMLLLGIALLAGW